MGIAMPRRLAIAGVVLMLAAGIGATAQAQNPPTSKLTYVEAKTIALKPIFGTQRDWHVTAYKPEGADADTGNLAVKICFWFDPLTKDAECTPIGSSELPHQNLRELSVVSLSKSPQVQGVVVDSYFSGGGSGIAREVSISTYDKADDIFSEVASLKLNEIGEYQIVDSGRLAGSIVTASGVWQHDEGHFGDHRFWVELLQYSQYYGRYERLLGYMTSVKYSGEELGVIGKEMATISKMPAQVYGDKNPLKESR